MKEYYFTDMRETADQGAWDMQMRLNADPVTRTIDPTTLTDEEVSYIRQMWLTGLYDLRYIANRWDIGVENARDVLRYCLGDGLR
jgi:hypothetical protein